MKHLPLLFALALFASDSFSQSDRPPRVVAIPAKESSLPDTIWGTPIESFDFPGGTLHDLADKLKPVVKQIDAIEVSSGADEKIPAFQMKDTTLSGVVSQVRWLQTGQFEAKSRATKRGERTSVVLDLKIYRPTRSFEWFYLPTVDFKGGTGTDLAEAIENLGMDWDNIHVTPAAAATEIPAFHVERLNFRDLQDVVASLSNNQLEITWRGTFLKIDAKKATPLTSNTETAILPLQWVLTGYTIEDINALVQTALEMRSKRIGGDSPKPDLSLHRDTETLIVVGDKEQVDVVRQVVSTLQQQPRQRHQGVPHVLPAP